MKSKFVIILISILIYAISGCKPKEKVAPVFPPENNISIDFSYFISPPESTGNYAHAFQTSVYWAHLLTDSLTLYKNMLNTISDKKFSYQDENTWMINSVLNSGTDKYDINYFEIVNADTVETKMFFTLDSTYTDLLLFDGYFFSDSTTGYRQINKPDTSNTYLKFLKIDWNIISENEKEIQFTNILTDNSKNGSFIFYKDSVDSQYNVYLDFFDKATDNHSFIEYNKTSFSGRIKDEQYYGDTDWHCWDTERLDTNCPVK